MRKHTPKEKLFVGYYLESLNGADAVRKAGYKSKRPDAFAYELLRKPAIQAAIQAAMEERAARIEVTADQVLAKLWLEAQRQGKGSSHAARIRALELVGRHVGLKFTEGLEVSGPNGGPIETQDAKEKLLGRLNR